MIKTIKKVLLSSFSILVVIFLIYLTLLLNPVLSYANSTQFGMVTVYHNQDLEEETGALIENVISIIRTSPLFNDETSIDFCMNDDYLYPKLNFLVGQANAYAIFDKTVLKNCKAKFSKNVTEFQWEVNNNEIRKFNLTWLLAHEFSHNLQYKADLSYVFKSTVGNINWKLEGHAEYIARAFKNDGKLKTKISKYLIEENKEQTGLPVIELEDGTVQILNYYKYALVIQYLFEEKGLNYEQLCSLDKSLDEIYQEMLELI